MFLANHHSLSPTFLPIAKDSLVDFKLPSVSLRGLCGSFSDFIWSFAIELLDGMAS